MKKTSKKEAFDKIAHLFDDAEQIAGEQVHLANKCITKARKIAMKNRIRLPSYLKKRFCKHCGAYFIPAKTYRVRMKNKKIIYTCMKCKKFMRFVID